MKPELDPRLAALVDAELKKLPPLAAPESLARDVMAVLAARANTPWWHRAWWDWPLTAKFPRTMVHFLMHNFLVAVEAQVIALCCYVGLRYAEALRGPWAHQFFTIALFPSRQRIR